MNITFHKENSKYIDIFRSIAKDINEGVLKGGDRLPSKRDLAISLNVSLNTVMTAYDLLLDEGYIYSKEKQGYYVSDQLVVNTVPEKTVIPEEPRKKPLYDFTTQNMEGFSSLTWGKLIREELYKEDYLNKTESFGDLGLRSVISGHLRTNRGIDCDPSLIVIGSGMEMLEHILLTTGIRTITLENPGYKKLEAITKNAGFSSLHAPLDENGVTVPETKTILYTTPFNQFPTGTKMSITRKKELISFARTTGSYIIEDDFDAEFRINSAPQASLYSLAPENVIFFSTFTETLFPGLRISYAILPKTLLASYKRNYGNHSTSVPSLEQLVLKDFMEGGYYESVINKAKRKYLKKRELILSLLEKSVLLSCDPKRNYLSILAKVNTTLSDQEIRRKLENSGIAIQMLSDFDTEKRDSHVLIIGYTAIPLGKIEEGIRHIEESLKN